MEPYIVYVKTNDAFCVVAINSSAFVEDATGWTEIDIGYGDRYHHAQGNYLTGLLTDERGIFRYKLVEGVVAERTQEEMDADYVPPVQTATQDERIKALETTTDDIILMMADLIGGM